MAMKVWMLLLAALGEVSALNYGYSGECLKVDTIDYGVHEAYCDQPIFFTFLPKSDENQMIDNICLTYFPLPDDPSTFHLYVSRVFCDGSNDVTSFIETQISIGVNRKANPYLTVTDHVVGYAGCDTNVVYRCSNYGDDYSYVFGASPSCRPIGLSCLRKVEEIIREHCLPLDDYYALPMKLPNRCVTQQICVTPPNPFYNKLPGYVNGGHIL